MRRTRFRFSHRAGGFYYWISELPLPRDSRHEQIVCPVDWFWAGPTPASASGAGPDRPPPRSGLGTAPGRP